MRDIRMVVTDLDGTLLRSDKTVSQYTRLVLRRLREKGIKLVAATARPMRAGEDMLPGIVFSDGIYHNGAVIGRGMRRMHGFGIDGPTDITRNILRDLPGSRISVECEEILYANYPAEETWPEIGYVYTEDFAVLSGKIADKIIVEADTQRKVDAIGALLPKDCYAQLCENRLALCMHRDASKIKAIELLARLYGMEMDEIVCFGDDHNDIEMLRACGRGIAVGNAIEEVKQAADEIALSNDEDGVARWIEENLL